MNTTPEPDTRSPWYEAFAATAAEPEPRWLPGTRFPAPEAAPPKPAAGAQGEEQWATQALFDCYNG